MNGCIFLQNQNYIFFKIINCILLMDLNSIKQKIRPISQFIGNIIRTLVILTLQYSKITIFFILPIFSILYCIATFPQELSHIQPQVFDSYDFSLKIDQTRDMKSMRPRVFTNDQITICPDIEVTINQIVYCINTQAQIVRMDPNQKYSEVLYTIEEGTSEGLRLSKDQKLLYFTNSNLGLCEFNINKRKVKTLVDNYQGKFLISLNAIQIHPKNTNILYFTQTSTLIPMERFQIEFWLNNPFGRVFQFNKKTQKLTLIAQGLYSPNGIIFKKYNEQDTVVIAETNRNRLTRIYLSGDKKGQKHIVLDKLQFYPDNIKAGEKGEILIGSMAFRDAGSRWNEQTVWVRKMYSRIPDLLTTTSSDVFGGMIAKLAQNSFDENQVKYCMWKSYPNFSSSTSLVMRKGRLFMSSGFDYSILVIDKIRSRLKKKFGDEDVRYNKRDMSVYKFGDRFQRKKSVFS